MIKFLVVLVLTLFGLSSISAAAIDLGDDVLEPVRDFEDGLRMILQDVSEQIKENANFDEYTDFDSFLRENNIYNEEAPLVTEEEEEFPANESSAVEDDRSNENVDSGIRCSWTGRAGHCCQIVRIVRVRLSICLLIHISPPTGMNVVLKLNGISIWHHTVSNHHNYRVCLQKKRLKLCFMLYHLYISTHSASACLHFSAKFHFIHISKNLGCFHRSFADKEISTAKKTSLEKSVEMQKGIPKETKQSNNVFRFDQ